MNSPTHKANILNDHFTEIGIATVDGTYQGNPTTYVVQMFGVPAEAPDNATKVSLVVDSTPKPVNVAVAPVVKGESSVIDSKLETITDTKEFVVVKNISAEEQIKGEATSSTRYSSWSDRFVFMMPAYTDRIYRVFIWIVTIALLLMVIFEIRRQKPKNIVYGILLLVIMVCLIYINKTMFFTSFLA